MGIPGEEQERLAAQLEEWKSTARKRQTATKWHARRYALAHARWEKIALTVTILGGLATVLAGGTLLSSAKDKPTVASIIGVLGLIAGAAQLVDRAAGPQKRAEDYLKGERLYSQMRARYRGFSSSWTDPTTADAEWRAIQEEDRRLHAEVPRQPPDWTHDRIVERESAPDHR